MMSTKWNDLRVEVVKVEGFCPVYKVGNKFLLESGYKLVCKESDDVCVHALGSFLSFVVGLSARIPLEDLGLGHEEDDVAYLRCLDPGPPLTEGGTVTFAIKRVPRE
jgi:uncharacterized repeat protein (TIGR04076 family)